MSGRFLFMGVQEDPEFDTHEGRGFRVHDGTSPGGPVVPAEIAEWATTERLLTLAESHLRRYRRMLEAHRQGAPNFRPDELTRLIAAWANVEQVGGVLAKVSPEAWTEIQDFYWCEVAP